MDRWLELDGAVNVRDLGGLPTEDGQTTAPGVVLRSDNLQGLSDKDVRRLVEDLGLRTVVDLRTPAEVAGEGPGPLVAAGVRHVNLDLIPGWDPQGDNRDRIVPHEKREKNDLSHFYLGYLDEAADAVVQALSLLADDATGTAVVHCAAGKDRTGTVVGLALKVVDVPDELVIADCAASAQRVAAIMDRLRTRPAYARNLQDKTVAQQSPTTDTMRLLLAALDERHGGVHGWLRAQGWTAADTDRMRHKLLAD